MTAVKLRKLIENDIARDQTEQGLRHYLADKGPLLHRSIRLSGDDQTDKLERFTLVYTRHAPDLIMDVRREAGLKSLDAYIEKTLVVAESFFMNPPDMPDIPNGLIKSVAAAYLVHRLIEEMNDIFHMCLGVSLWNHDITQANWLVHEMLGDAFANSLDIRVSNCVHTLTQGHDGLFGNADFIALQQDYRRHLAVKVA